MEASDEPESPPLSASVLFVALIAAATIIPWVMHFKVGWWAGIPSWFGLVAIYDKLFVAKGSLCMGIPFVFPLASFVLLIGLDLVGLIKWLISLNA